MHESAMRACSTADVIGEHERLLPGWACRIGMQRHVQQLPPSHHLSPSLLMRRALQAPLAQRLQIVNGGFTTMQMQHPCLGLPLQAAVGIGKASAKATKFSRVHTYKCCFCTRSVTPKWKPIVTSPVMLVLTAQSLLPVPVFSHRESNAACPAPDPYLESPDASVRDAPPAPRHAAISCPGDSD